MTKQDQLIAFLKTKIAEPLGCAVEALPSDRNVRELGLTSLHAVMIAGEVEEGFQIDVDPAVMFENETIEQIATAILKNE